MNNLKISALIQILQSHLKNGDRNVTFIDLGNGFSNELTLELDAITQDRDGLYFEIKIKD